MKNKPINFSITDNCPSCNSKNITNDQFGESLFINSSTINKSKTRYSFVHLMECCNDCGLIFNRCRPIQQDLNNYYIDQLSYKFDDYNPQQRVDLINKLITKADFSKDKARVLDFGGNTWSNFHTLLKELNCEVSFSDVGTETDENKFEIITSYFVFEHLLTPLEDLKNLIEKLTDDGIIIIEVPDLDIYANDTSGIIDEHLQHYNKSSLAHMLAKLGFVEIEHDEDCSRPFGFVSAFTREENAKAPEISKDAVSKNIENFSIGFEKYKALEQHYKLVADKITSLQSQGGELYLWGVNNNFCFIANYLSAAELKKITCIDGDPRKEDFAKLFGCSFIASSDIEKIPHNNSSVIILASLHIKAISDAIREKAKIDECWGFDILLEESLYKVDIN